MVRTRRSRSNSSRSSASADSLRRAKVVWVSLLGAMTAVGGLLLLLDNPAPRIDGRTMPALAATGMTYNLESIFRTNKPVEPGRWKAIVIHHSDSPVGSAESIAKEHTARGFKGIGHHFVIGNGRGMDDGDLHETFRWTDQLPGAHAGGKEAPFYNNNAISICLVGDGDRERFTPAQMQRLGELVDTLCTELKIPRDKVFLHSQLAPTSDPGRFFPEQQFRVELSGR